MAIVTPKIETTNISEKVYRWIKESIINLSFPPGHKLNIRELSEVLNVSSSPITHALYRLSGEGLVEISPRKETCVKQISTDDIREIWDTRIMLETGALEFVSFPLSSEQLEKLRLSCQEALREGSLEIDRYRSFVEKDYQFHLEIISLSNNSRIIEIYERLSAHMQLIRYGTMRHLRRDSSKLNEEHLGILNSLEKGDVESVRRSLRNHVARLKEVDFSPEELEG